jgi:arylamine N-acetyltransferase
MAAAGVCFEITAKLSRLLSSLGYQSQPIMAEIRTPWAHQALIVLRDEERYLVDNGNGAPFYEAIPLGGEPFELRRAGLTYRFRIDPALGTVQDRWIEEKWQPFVRMTSSHRFRSNVKKPISNITCRERVPGGTISGLNQNDRA